MICNQLNRLRAKSKSTPSLSQGMYASLPCHFTMELAVKTVEQEPELVAERRELLASKSVSELSQVTDRKNRNVFDLSLRSNPLPTSQCLILCNALSIKVWDLLEATKLPKILQKRRQQGKKRGN